MPRTGDFVNGMPLTFYFPADGPGGIQSIIVRLARAAYEVACPMVVYDHPDGYVSRTLKEQSPEAWKRFVIEVSDFSGVMPGKGSVFVAFNWQLPLARRLQRRCGIEYLLWDVHSAAIESMFWMSLFGRPIFKLDSAPFLKQAGHEQRLLTIDLGAKGFINRTVGEDSKAGVTGIPLDLQREAEVPRVKSDGPIRVVYVGRSVGWKVSPMDYALGEILETYPESCLEVAIYTDDAEAYRGLTSWRTGGRLLSYTIVQGKNIDEIWECERERVDLAVGMGTSQFEFLVRGVPSLMVPASRDFAILKKHGLFWVHRMPPFVFGFDEASVADFSGFVLPQRARFGQEPFGWTQAEMEEVLAEGRRVGELYGAPAVLGRLQDQAGRLVPGNPRSLMDCRLGISSGWSGVVASLKSLLKGLNMAHPNPHSRRALRAKK